MVEGGQDPVGQGLKQLLIGPHSCQGLCLDPHGNLALHVLYAEIPHQQQAQWKVPEDFFYQDITARDHFVGFPAHRKGTYYAVYYVKNIVDIRANRPLSTSR